MPRLINTYSRLPIAFTRRQGAWLIGEDGEKYPDAVSGIAVTGLGNSHPKMVATIADQVGRQIHTSNLCRVREQEDFSRRSCTHAGMDEVFFANSGSEAHEGALKRVRFYGHKHSNPYAQTLVMERAWHGRDARDTSSHWKR